MGGGGKAKAFNPFNTKSQLTLLEEEKPNQAEIAVAEFTSPSVTFKPSGAKSDANIGVSFACSVKLVRGDVINIKLQGCTGPPGLYSVESKEFRDVFYCYWSDLGGFEGKGGKGGAPPQTLMIQIRKVVAPGTMLTFTIPASAGIQLPDKLPATSTKLKIEGTRILHAMGSSKIPKLTITTFTDVKKKLPQEELIDLDEISKEIVAQGILGEEEVRLASEVTVQEWDALMSASGDLSQLKLGLTYRVEQQTFHQPRDVLRIANTLQEVFKEHNSKRGAFLLHQELARNLGVETAVIICFEESIFVRHGQFYPELSRGALMVLRMWCCDGSDLQRIFGISQNINMQRDILYAMRTDDIGLITNWIHSISALLTAARPINYIPSELIPVVYRGLKELSNDAMAFYSSLRSGDVIAFPTFSTCSVDVILDDNFSCPDNAVLFQIHRITEGVELGDISQFPEDREWLLPPFSTFTVHKVEQLPDRNNLLRVELQMRTSLSGIMRDESFTEDASKAFRLHVTKLRTQEMPILSERSSVLAKLMQCRIKQHIVKQQHPDFLMQTQYLEQFANVRRQSQAKKVCEEGIVKWYQSTSETDHSSWELLQKKVYATVEAWFQKCTRVSRQFTLPDGMVLDFTNYTMQTGGPKVPPKNIRRMMGKHVTHPYNAL